LNTVTNSTSTANRQIARAAGTVMAAFILSNLTGLLRNIFILNAFGTGQELDAFNAANQVTDTLFNLVAGGALASSFIPTFTGLLTQGDHRGAWKLASAIGNLILLVLTLLGAAAALFAPQIVRYLLAPGFSANPDQVALTVDLVRLMMPAAVIFGLSGLVMGILNSHQIFLIPALTPSLYSLGLIFGATVLSPRIGIYGLGWGVLIGASLHLGLQIPTLMRRGGEYFATLGLQLPAVREVGRLFWPRLFGVGVVYLNFWVNIWLASHHPEGSVTAIKTAIALMLMPQAAIAQSIAIAAMPTLAAQFARGQMEEVRSSLAASLRGVLLLSIPASLGLILLREPLIVMIYQRGAFDARSTELVSWALLWYSVGLVGHSVVEIMARAFYALRNTLTPVMVGSAAMSLNVLLSIGLAALFDRIGWLPHGGLALANSLATAVEMIGLVILMRRRLGRLEGKSIAAVALKALAAALLMSLGLWAWMNAARGLPAWQVTIVGVALGGLIYGAAVLAAGIPEVRNTLGWIIRRLKALRP
jgi:putative peptidoglycan lipid II flippase